MFSCMQVPLLLEAGRREFSRNKDSVRLACFTQGAEANLKNWAIRSSAMGHYEIASSARWTFYSPQWWISRSFGCAQQQCQGGTTNIRAIRTTFYRIFANQALQKLIKLLLESSNQWQKLLLLQNEIKTLAATSRLAIFLQRSRFSRIRSAWRARWGWKKNLGLQSYRCPWRQKKSLFKKSKKSS